VHPAPSILNAGCMPDRRIARCRRRKVPSFPKERGFFSGSTASRGTTTPSRKKTRLFRKRHVSFSGGAAAQHGSAPF
jgi:hypothetical protein